MCFFNLICKTDSFINFFNGFHLKVVKYAEGGIRTHEPTKGLDSSNLTFSALISLVEVGSALIIAGAHHSIS